MLTRNMLDMFYFECAITIGAESAKLVSERAVKHMRSYEYIHVPNLKKNTTQKYMSSSRSHSDYNLLAELPKSTVFNFSIKMGKAPLRINPPIECPKQCKVIRVGTRVPPPELAVCWITSIISPGWILDGLESGFGMGRYRWLFCLTGEVFLFNLSAIQIAIRIRANQSTKWYKYGGNSDSRHVQKDGTTLGYPNQKQKIWPPWGLHFPPFEREIFEGNPPTPCHHD